MLAATRSQPLTKRLDPGVAQAREIFPHTAQGKIYLNHAGTAPMCTPVVEAITAHLRERSFGLIETYMAQDVAKLEECRRLVQELIGAESPDRIALMTNTSDPLSAIASGLTWRSGERILVHEEEFPANVWPYLSLRRHGVEVDTIPQKKGHPTAELIAESVTDRTRLVALSAVQFLSGYRANLDAIGEFCRRRNIIFVVDGIQAAGAMRIDVQRMKIDAFASGCQKWQLGPQGTGWLYLTEELQHRIQPRFVGWLAVENPWDFFNYTQPLASTARVFEGGTKNIPGLHGMAAALKILLDAGIETIEARIRRLTQTLMEGLQEIDGVTMATPQAPDERAGIVTVELPAGANAKMVFRFLLERNITVAIREGRIRYAPHFYNTEEEMTEAVAITREAVNKNMQFTGGYGSTS